MRNRNSDDDDDALSITNFTLFFFFFFEFWLWLSFLNFCNLGYTTVFVSPYNSRIKFGLIMALSGKI
jgi:hypothetical protein